MERLEYIKDQALVIPCYEKSTVEGLYMKDCTVERPEHRTECC